jgi:hypothetical protein
MARIRARDVLGGAYASFRREPARVLVTAVLVFGVLGVTEARLDFQAEPGSDVLTVGLLITGALFAAAGSVAYPAFLDRLIGDEREAHRDESVAHILRTLPYGRILGADLLVASGVGLVEVQLADLLAARHPDRAETA